MGWPQWTVTVLVLLDTGWAIAKHGETRKPYNCLDALINAGLLFWLLWCGGFFS